MRKLILGMVLMAGCFVATAQKKIELIQTIDKLETKNDSITQVLARTERKLNVAKTDMEV